MPIQESNSLSQREFKTLIRIQTVQSSSRVLRGFFDKGFKSFEALKAIVLHYQPDMNVQNLWDFWHFRRVDEVMCDALEDVFEKLKSE